MSEKKLKTGDVVCWAVVDRDGYICQAASRNDARELKADWDKTNAIDAPHRIAKVVLAK